MPGLILAAENVIFAKKEERIYARNFEALDVMSMVVMLNLLLSRRILPIPFLKDFQILKQLLFYAPEQSGIGP